MFTRTETIKEFTTRFPITTGLIFLNLLAFAAMELTGSSTSLDTLLKFGALDYDAVLGDGQYYRIISSMFLHIGFMHLLFNMFCLYVFSAELERILGKAKFLLFYLASGAGGSLLALFMQQHAITAGASGAIFGTFGLFVYFIATKNPRLPHEAAGIILPLVAVNFIVTVFTPGISLFGHLGGFVAGFLLGGLFSKSRN